jgi:hypothetical protein
MRVVVDSQKHIPISAWKAPPLSPVCPLLSLLMARYAKMQELVPFHGPQTACIFTLRLARKAWHNGQKGSIGGLHPHVKRNIFLRTTSMSRRSRFNRVHHCNMTTWCGAQGARLREVGFTLFLSCLRPYALSLFVYVSFLKTRAPCIWSFLLCHQAHDIRHA